MTTYTDFKRRFKFIWLVVASFLILLLFSAGGVILYQRQTIATDRANQAIQETQKLISPFINAPLLKAAAIGPTPLGPWKPIDLNHTVYVYRCWWVLPEYSVLLSRAANLSIDFYFQTQGHAPISSKPILVKLKAGPNVIRQPVQITSDLVPYTWQTFDGFMGEMGYEYLWSILPSIKVFPMDAGDTLPGPFVQGTWVRVPSAPDQPGPQPTCPVSPSYAP